MTEETTNKPTVKALDGGESGDWILDVRGIPFGSDRNRDSDGEWFTPETRLHDDKFPTPPAVYYHGYEPDGQPAGTPEYIGKTVDFENRNDGRWYRVILDKSNQFAQRVWEAARDGIARASSGSVGHLSRVAPNGEIREWPVAELSLFDAIGDRQPANRHAVAIPVVKSMYKQAGLNWPETAEDETERAETEGSTDQRVDAETETNPAIVESETDTMEDLPMSDDNERADGLTADEVGQIVQDAIKSERDQREAEAAAIKARETELQEAAESAVKAAREEWEEEAKKSRRLPYNADNAPMVGRFGDLRRFDHLDAGDMATMIHVLKAAKEQPSEAAYKALIVKVGEDKTGVGEVGRSALKAFGLDATDAIKANEVNYSTLASYGDEWVFDAQGQALWESVRNDTNVGARIPSVEIPQGAESLTIPLESTDPTFYLVGQVTGDAATGGLSSPAPTVPSSRLGTAQNQITVKKIGARVRWSTELDEDSLVPFANQLRMQLAKAGAETWEHTMIDGDTATTASTNINDIAGTPAGTEAFLAVNGFRKAPLVTTTANSRPGGAIDADDFLQTLRLMGNAGANAADQSKVSFILDPNVYWKSLEEISEIKTEDVWAGNPTIKDGQFTSIWGYEVLRSYFMHWQSRAYAGYNYKANTAGKIDQDTTSNNTTGSILAVRWDQWIVGWKRRMVIKVKEEIEWDGHVIVATMRYGLTQRDTEGAAITYNLTV